MKQPMRSAALVALFLLLGRNLSGCGGGHRADAGGGTRSGSSDSTGQLTQLRCGNTTYRLGAGQIDGEVNEACDRANKSYEANRSNRAARTRFTCQDSKGHVVASLQVPDALLEDYNKGCQRYLVADEPFENGTADRSTHFDALKRFQNETKQLTRDFADEANAIWHQDRADQALINKLIKNRGGSIEIAE